MKDIELKYKETSLVSLQALADAAETLSPYIARLREVSESEEYDTPEAFINLPFDRDIVGVVKEAAGKAGGKELSYIIVVGIGGSNLGTLAVYDALRGKLDAFRSTPMPKIIFADTNDPDLLADIQSILGEHINSPEQILVNIISKSGTTTETIANFEVLYGTLKERFGEESAKKRVVVTTDRGSKLWSEAQREGFALLEIPQQVGGRYSVFSAVGLFPLSLAGMDIDALLEGARVMRDKCLSEGVEENPALLSAALIHLHYKAGISIHNSFFFNSQLESLGKWYRQLLGESIGKKHNAKGEEVRVGITPIVSMGPADLHSMAQLYLGGPKDKFTTFMYTPESERSVRVPEDTAFPALAESVAGKSLTEIMRAIFSGTKEAYRKGAFPFMEVVLPDISEGSLGQYLQFKMMEMMFLARLLGVNAFDQPAVEDYKSETRRILNGS
ncbi:MAG: glucose-6-phosphate isomerase [Patescibacteria group bacterium]|nr:MAG: glucose-6-phosphate isomerase [Patescibacteria group bacterium]